MCFTHSAWFIVYFHIQTGVRFSLVVMHVDIHHACTWLFPFFPHSLDTQNNLCVRMFYVFIMGDFDFPDLIHSMCVRVELPFDSLHPFIYFPCVFCMRR